MINLRRQNVIKDINFSGNNIGQYLFDKVDKLSSVLADKNMLDNCTPLDKKKISVIINELKYDANRIRNSKIFR